MKLASGDSGYCLDRDTTSNRERGLVSRRWYDLCTRRELFARTVSIHVSELRARRELFARTVRIHVSELRASEVVESCRYRSEKNIGDIFFFPGFFFGLFKGYVVDGVPIRCSRRE